MKKYIEDELNDAMNTLEVLINSEHQDLIMGVLSSYIRNKKVDKAMMTEASRITQALCK
jgi:hypothetical protein